MKKSKRSPTRQDVTVRNVQAANRKFASLLARVAALEARVVILEAFHPEAHLPKAGLHSFSG